MEKMDERAKAELYKINHEKFFLSVLIVAVFLTAKIYLKVGILSMLGELTAAGVIISYLIPYFIIRRKYETLDEMAKTKLYKLSTAFMVAELIAMIPVIIIDTIMMINKIGETKITIMDSNFLFAMSLLMIINVYGLIRLHNEKFVARKAAALPLSVYKKKILIRAVVATVAVIALLITSAIINNYISGRPEYSESSSLSLLANLLSTMVLACVLGTPLIWFLYFYYLGTRKKLARKLQNSDESEKASLNGKKKFFYKRYAADGILFFIIFFIVSMADSMIQGNDKKIGITILIYSIGLAVYLGITLTVYFIQKKRFKKRIEENVNKEDDNYEIK